ncbi:hypothetical protein AX17_000441 [Amanita inopinata Kibby_2008]|nr:hypothetical protein AX17_000441 [Amanita inopinata Kibby_2008]
MSAESKGIRQDQIVSATDAVPPLPIFSQAVISKGHIFVSGNIGCDKNFNVVPGGVQVQTVHLRVNLCTGTKSLTKFLQRAALENISTVLRAAGSGLEFIVKANVYLTNMSRDFAAMNEVYAQFFDKQKMPARTCIGVQQLPMGAEVEIECIAELP